MCAHPDHKVEAHPDGSVEEVHVFTYAEMQKLISAVEASAYRGWLARTAHAYPQEVRP
jgi:hypothetical protein